MAQLISPIASMIRGSVAGLTFSATRNSPITLRRRLSPVHVFSMNRVASKGSLGVASGMWNALTQLQRDAWVTFGLSLSKTKPEGAYTLTGREAMMGVTAFAHRMFQLGLISAEPSGVAPVVFGWETPPTFTVTTLVVAGTGFRVRVQYPLSQSVDIFYCLSYAGSGRRMTRNSYMNQSTWTKLSLSGISDQYIVLTGLTAGAAYYLQIRCMNPTAPYRISNLITVRGVAAVYP